MPEDVIDYNLMREAPDPPDDMVMHPLYLEYQKIVSIELPEYERVLNGEESIDQFVDSFMKIKNMGYKNMIRGYHMAFNIQDPLSQQYVSKYKFVPRNDLSAEEIRKRVVEAKERRDKQKKEQAKLETEKYQKDRMELRKMHERMRNKKMEEMMAGGQKDTPENFLEKNIRTISANRSQ